MEAGDLVPVVVDVVNEVLVVVVAALADGQELAVPDEASELSSRFEVVVGT